MRGRRAALQEITATAGHPFSRLPPGGNYICQDWFIRFLDVKQTEMKLVRAFAKCFAKFNCYGRAEEDLRQFQK